MSTLTLLRLFLLFTIVVFSNGQMFKRVPQGVQLPVDNSMSSNSIPITSMSLPPPVVSITGSSLVEISAVPTPPLSSGLNVGSGLPAVNTMISGNTSTGLAASNNTDNNLAGLPTSASYGYTVLPGTAIFLQPTPSKSVSPLYRINGKENVTFVWSFTNLLVTPANLTLAAVAPNKVTYTITTMDGMATSAVWHISNVPAASPLMMGVYQIQLCDQRGPSAIPQPGWLTPVTRLSIAFYSAESYQPNTGSSYCPTCFYSASMKPMESFEAFVIAFSIASVTSITFLYKIMY